MQCLLDALKLHSTTSKTCKGKEALPEEKSISGTPCLDIDAELVNRVQICASLNEIEVFLGEDLSADRLGLTYLNGFDLKDLLVPLEIR